MYVKSMLKLFSIFQKYLETQMVHRNNPRIKIMSNSILGSTPGRILMPIKKWKKQLLLVLDGTSPQMVIQ